MAGFRVTPTRFRQVAIIVVACYAALVITGGAVRLTGSGLGCPDWPTCYQHAAIAQASFHPLVEFINRLVTVAVTVLTFAALGAVYLRTPRRRDLVGFAWLLVAGIVAQIVLGGLVVLFKLNPYLVALHFLLTLVILLVAIVMTHRASLEDRETSPVVQRAVLVLSRILVGALSLVIVAGTFVSGAGPHAGAPGSDRIRVAFRDIAELHSTLALFLIGLMLATLFALHIANAPARTQKRARLLLEVLAVQGVLGYTQYFLHDAAVVVEFHLAGATSAWCAAIAYYLSLHEHVAPATTHAGSTAVDASTVRVTVA